MNNTKSTDSIKVTVSVDGIVCTQERFAVVDGDAIAVLIDSLDLTVWPVSPLAMLATFHAADAVI